MRFDRGLDRRAALASALLVSSPSVIQPPASVAATDGTSALASARLLSLLPAMSFGAPATNATLTTEVAAQIEAEAEALEALGKTKNLANNLAGVDGSWRLLYSNAREITNLAKGLPLGFALSKIYQPIDVATGRFENQGFIEHVYGLARASTLVVGEVRAAPLGTVNAAGTLNKANNRVDIDFRRLTFELDEAFGRETSLRKVVVPKQKTGAAQPANDITYLDDNCRVTRGGDGASLTPRSLPAALPHTALTRAVVVRLGRFAVYFPAGGKPTRAAHTIRARGSLSGGRR